FAAMFFFERVLEAGFFPAGEVVFVEVAAMLAEPLENLGISEAIIEHLVDGVSEFAGQATDFVSMSRELGQGRRGLGLELGAGGLGQGSRNWKLTELAEFERYQEPKMKGQRFVRGAGLVGEC